MSPVGDPMPEDEREDLLGPVVLAQADQDFGRAEVLVPGRVEDAVGGGEDPLVTDQTCPTQQLLRAPLVQHHLPADGIVSTSPGTVRSPR